MSDVRTLIIPTNAQTPDVVLSSLFSEVRASVPASVRNDGETFAIILADPSAASGRSYDARTIPDGAEIVLAMGVADQAPTDGTFSLSYDGNSTGLTALPFDISAAALQTALNANAARAAAGPVTVSKVGNDYLIADTAVGARELLIADGGLLVPLSAATVRRYREGTGGGQKEAQILSLAQAPYATATDFDPLPDADHDLTSIQTGTSELPSIQLLTLDPAPYGGSFTVDDKIIPWNASEQEFANAYGGGVSVVKVDEFSWQFTRGTNGAHTSTVSLTRLLVPTGFLVTLNLSTYEFLFAFAKSTQETLTAKLSLRVTFPDELPKTFLLADAEVFRSVIDSDNLVSAAVTGYPSAAALNATLTPQSVVNNAAKLALTGIAAGYLVKITGEGNRIEQYLGGTISSNASWLVLRNTIHLYVSQGNNSTSQAATINATATISGDISDHGWVDPLALPITAGTLSGAGGDDGGFLYYAGDETTPAAIVPHSFLVSSSNSVLPVPAPLRGTVTIIPS